MKHFIIFLLLFTSCMFCSCHVSSKIRLHQSQPEQEQQIDVESEGNITKLSYSFNF